MSLRQSDWTALLGHQIAIKGFGGQKFAGKLIAISDRPTVILEDGDGNRFAVVQDIVAEVRPGCLGRAPSQCEHCGRAPGDHHHSCPLAPLNGSVSNERTEADS